MATTLNTKGTSFDSFKIGKRGTTLYQGTSIDPANAQDGDFYFDPILKSLKVRDTPLGTPAWVNPKFDDLSITGNTIISTSGQSSVSINGNVTFIPSEGGQVQIGSSRILTVDDAITVAEFGGYTADQFLTTIKEYATTLQCQQDIIDAQVQRIDKLEKLLNK